MLGSEQQYITCLLFLLPVISRALIFCSLSTTPVALNWKEGCNLVPDSLEYSKKQITHVCRKSFHFDNLNEGECKLKMANKLLKLVRHHMLVNKSYY